MNLGNIYIYITLEIEVVRLIYYLFHFSDTPKDEIDLAMSQTLQILEILVCLLGKKHY